MAIGMACKALDRHPMLTWSRPMVSLSTQTTVISIKLFWWNIICGILLLRDVDITRFSDTSHERGATWDAIGNSVTISPMTLGDSMVVLRWPWLGLLGKGARLIGTTAFVMMVRVRGHRIWEHPIMTPSRPLGLLRAMLSAMNRPGAAIMGHGLGLLGGVMGPMMGPGTNIMVGGWRMRLTTGCVLRVLRLGTLPWGTSGIAFVGIRLASGFGCLFIPWSFGPRCGPKCVAVVMNFWWQGFMFKAVRLHRLETAYADILTVNCVR